MGMRNGCYATVWEIEPHERYTKVRLSVSRKNRETGEYDQEFSGYCNFIGTAHAMANNLKIKDRIKVKDFDVTTRYDKERKTTYTNFAVFDYELPGDSDKPASKKPVDDNEPDADDLPF